MREFYFKESERNIKHAELLKFAAIGHHLGNTKWVEEVEATWKEYVALEFGLEDLKNIPVVDQEQKWQAEYNSIKKLKPKLSVTEDGKLKVSGIN